MQNNVIQFSDAIGFHDTCTTTPNRIIVYDSNIFQRAAGNFIIKYLSSSMGIHCLNLTISLIGYKFSLL
jgi:hypothetical protein